MYLVCDGGGTKTDFLLFDARGTVLASWRGAGTNALFCPVEAAAAVVCEGVRRCLQRAGAKPEELRRAALFIPGFRAALPLVEAELGVRGIALQGDAESAFYGALGGTAGIVVLSGTGSFCLGRDRAGTAARAGGWGPLFGDEGSGYHIGLLCLGEITRQYDAGAADSPLTALALRQLDVPDVPSLRSAQTDAARFGRAGIASLTRAVGQAALQGDPAAGRVLDAAAQALVRLAATVAARLAADGLPVSLTGGVAAMGEPLVGRFRRALAGALPGCPYRAPRYAPVVGAALCLLHDMEGLDISDPALLERLTERP